jgi:hypothetical protein
MNLTDADRQFTFADVFFPHSWIMNKSLDQVLAFIEILKSRSVTPLKLIGLELGDQQDLARRAGFELVPVSDKATHINRMRMSKVVMGQANGVFGVTDLEAIISKSNFLPFPLQESCLDAYGYTRETQPSKSVEDSVKKALLFIDLPEQPEDSSLDRILEKHSDDYVFSQLMKLYSQPGVSVTD